MSKVKIISVVQMKGGVGKTNCTVNLASILAKDFNKRVLVADFDPQTNATLSLISEERWNDWDKTNGTMADVLGMKRADGDRPKKNIDDYIIKEVNSKIPGLHLLPSHLKMTFIDTTLAARPGRERLFQQKIETVANNYDYIFCDCPPNLMTVTQNALYASNYYLIPMQPDYLSILGLQLILNRVAYLKKSLSLKIKPLGVIFTRARRHVNYHAKVLDSLPSDPRFSKLKFFTNIIPENISLAEASHSNLPICIFDGSSPGALAYRALAEELLELT